MKKGNTNIEKKGVKANPGKAAKPGKVTGDKERAETIRALRKSVEAFWMADELAINGDMDFRTMRVVSGLVSVLSEVRKITFAAGDFIDAPATNDPKRARAYAEFLNQLERTSTVLGLSVATDDLMRGPARLARPSQKIFD